MMMGEQKKNAADFKKEPLDKLLYRGVGKFFDGGFDDDIIMYENLAKENMYDTVMELQKIDGPQIQVKTLLPSTLKEYLRITCLQTRVRTQFGSESLYPTEEVKPIIQGLLTASLNLMKSGKSIRYLLQPDNIILKYQGCHPYSDYVYDLPNITGNQTILQNMACIREAGLIAVPTVSVSFLHDWKKNPMGDMIDNPMDDMKALEHLIFRHIIPIDKNYSLPADWEDFRSLILNSSPINYLLIASHPCLWDTKKMLKYFGFLDDCYYKSTPYVRKLVVDSLENMAIFRTNWLSNLNTEKELVEFRDRNVPEKGYKMDRVYCLITFFRNLTEHLHERVNAKSQYKNMPYLIYKLGVLFPNLLGEIHGRLLLVGFIY